MRAAAVPLSNGQPEHRQLPSSLLAIGSKFSQLELVQPACGNTQLPPGWSTLAFEAKFSACASKQPQRRETHRPSSTAAKLS